MTDFAIQLTTAFDAGDMDAGSPYAQVKVIRCEICSVAKTITMLCRYGNTVSSVWTEGITGASHVAENIVEGAQHFDNIMGTTPESGDGAGEALLRTCYQWLVDQGHFAGTVTEV